MLVTRKWDSGLSVAEYTLGTIPIQMILRDIPKDIWGFEAVGKISSSIEILISAKMVSKSSTPMLLLSVVIHPKFDYPNHIKARPKGGGKDDNILVYYSLKMSNSDNYNEFDH